MNALPPFRDARVLHAPNHRGQPGTDISVFLAGGLACVPVLAGVSTQRGVPAVQSQSAILPFGPVLNTRLESRWDPESSNGILASSGRKSRQDMRWLPIQRGKDGRQTRHRRQEVGATYIGLSKKQRLTRLSRNPRIVAAAARLGQCGGDENAR